MVNRKVITSIAAISIMLLVAACHSTKLFNTVPSSGGSELLFKYQWNLIEMQAQSFTVSSGNIPHLLFFPGKISTVSGSTGCNKLKGSFELSNVNLIKFSPLATTKMSCAGDNIESKYIAALGKADNWRITNEQLLLSNGKMLLMKFKGVMVETSELSGEWQLNYISGSRIAFDGLYPDKKPFIKFNLTENEVGGNTTCNGFSSKIILKGNEISIAEPFAKTMIFCEGGGETTFLNILKKVNRYAVTNKNTLTFLIGDVAVMRFEKK